MIKIQSLNKCYSNVKVLNNVNLEIGRGEIFGIIGKSGAGKSTLLRCINKLEECDSGNLEVMNKNINVLKGKGLMEFRKELGMIFQNFNLLSRKDVFHNVALPMEFWGISKEKIHSRVMELLELVGLKDKYKSKVSELSGGQKQRVAIARALTLNPKILLCDEATSALDPETTKSILKLLKKINDELGITIVIVTHQMEVIKEICERAAVMENGEIKELRKVENLFLKPSETMKRLLGEEEIIPDYGVNIKLFYSKEKSNQCVITSMARELDINFSIEWGKLERFREDVFGSLIINIADNNKEKVIAYLNINNIPWQMIDCEVIKNVI
ncbi:methionine ABC transporter ATP-binding protein [Haloimpatiens sp. FM7330]|uniref:methionine ABC transporter ATP-binding protein n=1 Tax=Haloimpatiens sp. FM7330 TaxID=3298610 RepID=UPI00363B1D3F